MADLTNKQAMVANEMTALENNILAFHNNLALFGESFRWETFRDMAMAGGAGLAAELLAAWALRRPRIRQAQGETS